MVEIECDTPGCFSRVEGKGTKCVGHGGGNLCSIPGCVKLRRSKGLCGKHGGGSKCRVDSCKREGSRGGLCATHLPKSKCAEPGCNSLLKGRTFCDAHTIRKCSMLGCNVASFDGRRCYFHGAGASTRCSSAGCTFSKGDNGLCFKHEK